MAWCRKYNFATKRAVATGIWNTIVSFTVLCVAIWEKARLTPFYKEMKCDPVPPMALRMSLMSLPSPMAEMMGMAPGSPPYGMYFNISSAMTCKNPMQATVTMQAAESTIEMLLPNLSDFLSGGSGRPYVKVFEGNLANDAKFASGGGSADIKQTMRVALPLADVMGMSATAAMLGYVPQFVKTSMPIESCLTIVGYPLCKKSTQEQWCGMYGGSCMAQSLDSDGNPIVPTQWEPAMCGMTKAVCGKEADMKAALNFETLGGRVIGQMPCTPATGLPNTTMCNLVTAPGVDPLTLEAKSIDPPQELTVQAQKDMDEMIAQGELSINMLLLPAIILNLISGIAFSGCTVFSYRRYSQARKSGEAEGQSAGNGNPTILDVCGEQVKNISV